MKLELNRRTGRGFTLFEMVVTMGIVGILAALAVPSFTYVTTANRIASEGNGLLGDLQFARSEAIKQGQTVTACVSTNGTTCAANNTHWNLGWIVFADANSNHVVDAGENVLKWQKPFGGSDTFVASNNAAYIIYNREGFSPGLINGTLLTLHASPVSNASTRCLSVTMVGMMQITPFGGTCL